MARLPSILKEILDAKRSEVAARRAKLGSAELSSRIAGMPPCRGFAAAIEARRRPGPAVIAEIKKASPSAGVIRADFDPATIAAAYERAGAACLSVLTDARHFQGADEHLRQARAAGSLPVLRKDFLIDPWQILEARHIGADCVLLIAAALSPATLQEFTGLALETGLDVLVEVHTESELEAALATPASLIGVNNRNLDSFTTDLAVSERLRPLIPASRCMISESGIHARADVERLRHRGIDAFLVGEVLMRAEDPGAALQGLFFDGSQD